MNFKGLLGFGIFGFLFVINLFCENATVQAQAAPTSEDKTIATDSRIQVTGKQMQTSQDTQTTTAPNTGTQQSQSQASSTQTAVNTPVIQSNTAITQTETSSSVEPNNAENQSESDAASDSEEIEKNKKV